ncbi:MAG: phosphate ABC transporter permease PstA [Candidatus Marinimicrobia bacterium]|nr:phosphate ABC transporter permease PstA [Candidatus Neomarinimicrobiota bacterium]
MKNNIGKRIFLNHLFKVLIISLSLFTIIPLFLILYHIVKNGISVIDFEFFIRLPKPPGEEGGGILHSLVGTLILVIIAFIIATPLGIFTGVFLAEVKDRFSNNLRFLINIIQGIPSIVIGILVYIWIVIPMGGFSAFAGGVALAIMMLPVVIKSTEETIKMIPDTLKEASYSLGVNYTRTILKVVIPSGFGGIASGLIVAISRVAGETAPLLFTAFGSSFLNVNPFKPIDALPLLVFNYAMSLYESWHRIAWGASFVLLVFVLILNVLVKIAGAKWRTRF